MDEKRKKIVFIDGGLGRVFCSIPAVERLAETEEVIVIASHIEPYMYNDKIERIYHISHPYLFEDLIMDNDFIHPEPYTYSGYYRDKKHLITAFDELINSKEKISEKPFTNGIHIYLSEDEEKFGKEFVDGMKKQFNKDKIIIFQPFGQGATSVYPEGVCGGAPTEVKDSSNRSLSLKLTTEFIKELSKDYAILYYGQIPLDIKELIVPGPQPPNTRGWLSIIKNCDAILAVDSSLQHMAYAMNIPGAVMLGATYESNITYPEHFKVFKRDGYPKMYDPIRIPAMNLTTSAAKKNQGALMFGEREVQQIINTMREIMK